MVSKLKLQEKESVMKNDNNLVFIKQKISLLRTAVMYSMCNSVVKLPNDIVTFVSIDEEGSLWILSHFPLQLLSECEQIFPVRLHFFRKGYDYHIEVSGKATIVNNTANSEMSFLPDIENKKAVLIKMTMSNIEYTEPHTISKSKLQIIAEKSYRWMTKVLAPNQHSVNNFHQSH